MKEDTSVPWRSVRRIGGGALALALLLTGGTPSEVGAAGASRHGRPGWHGVLGTAFTDFGYGRWQHWYQVLQTGTTVTGVIREHLIDDAEGLDTRFTTVVDCLDIDESTKEAWIGGRVVQVTGGFPPVGTKVVYYVDDNHGTGSPDVHGGIFTGAEWGEPDYTCTDRPAAWFPDPSQRGRIRVF